CIGTPDSCALSSRRVRRRRAGRFRMFRAIPAACWSDEKSLRERCFLAVRNQAIRRNKSVKDRKKRLFFAHLRTNCHVVQLWHPGCLLRTWDDSLAICPCSHTREGE